MEATEDAAARSVIAIQKPDDIARGGTRVDGHGAVELEQRRVAVEQLDVLRPAADLGRVDLEVEEEDVLGAGPHVPEVEGDLPVPARLADGRRDGRVQRDPLDPAGVEHERRSLDLPVGADREAGHEEEAAANVLGRVDLELDAVRGGGVGLRSLAERVQQAEEAEQSERREHGPAHERPSLATGEVAVPLQSQPVRRRGHAKQFARGVSSPTGGGRYTTPSPSARSSGDRALPCGGRGRTFESCRAHRSVVAKL